LRDMVDLRYDFANPKRTLWIGLVMIAP
jgi:hypothetical protein